MWQEFGVNWSEPARMTVGGVVAVIMVQVVTVAYILIGFAEDREERSTKEKAEKQDWGLFGFYVANN